MWVNNSVSDGSAFQARPFLSFWGSSASVLSSFFNVLRSFSSAKEKCYFLIYVKMLNIKIGGFVILRKYTTYSLLLKVKWHFFLLSEYQLSKQKGARRSVTWWSFNLSPYLATTSPPGPARLQNVCEVSTGDWHVYSR